MQPKNFSRRLTPPFAEGAGTAAADSRAPLGRSPAPNAANKLLRIAVRRFIPPVDGTNAGARPSKLLRPPGLCVIIHRVLRLKPGERKAQGESQVTCSTQCQQIKLALDPTPSASAPSARPRFHFVNNKSSPPSRTFPGNSTLFKTPVAGRSAPQGRPQWARSRGWSHSGC